MDCITEIRYYHFIVAVLTQQQHDPFCCRCKAFTNSVRAIRDGMAELEERRSTEAGLLPERPVQLLAYATTALAALRPDPDAVGFPLLGRFPAGVEKGAQTGAPLLAELLPDERELWEDGHTVQGRKSDADLSAI